MSTQIETINSIQKTSKIIQPFANSLETYFTSPYAFDFGQICFYGNYFYLPIINNVSNGNLLIQVDLTGTVTNPAFLTCTDIGIAPANIYAGESCIISNGQMYVSLIGNNVTYDSIISFSIDINGNRGSPSTFISNIPTTIINEPISLATDNTYLYISNLNSSTITRTLLLSPFTTTTFASTGLSSPNGLVLDSTNTYLYTANYLGNNITQTNVSIPLLTIPFVTGLLGPSGIAIDSTNTYLYVANFNNNTLNQITIASPTTITELASGLSSPNNILVYNNYLYISNSGDNTILRIALEPVCFNHNTKILCFHNNREEYRPIQDLRKGDLVKTLKDGYKKIEMIGTSKFVNNPSKFNCCMYKMKKNPTNSLLEDLVVTGAHSVLVDRLPPSEKGYTVTDEIDGLKCMIASQSPYFEAINDNNIYTIYHFVCENEDGNNNRRFAIWANGILTESISKHNFNNCGYKQL
jgi:hypothetical protein